MTQRGWLRIYEGWLISWWPEVEGRELYSPGYKHLNFWVIRQKNLINNLSYFQFRIIEILSENINNIDLHTVAQEGRFKLTTHSVHLIYQLQAIISSLRWRRSSLVPVLTMMMTSLQLLTSVWRSKTDISTKKRFMHSTTDELRAWTKSVNVGEVCVKK